MEPFQTHGANLPQQDLTRPAEGCPSGLRPEDLLRGGHEGANPHVGQREAINEVVDSATTDTLQPPEVLENTCGDDYGTCSGTKILTRLSAYSLLKAKDLSPAERVRTIVSYFGPRYELSRNEEELKTILTAFMSRCKALLTKSRRNEAYFKKKNADWLNETIVSGELISNENQMLSPKSKKFKALSKATKYRSQKQVQDVLNKNATSNNIKAFVASLKVNDRPLPKPAAKSLEAIINLCLTSETAATDVLAQIERPLHPCTPEEAVSIIVDRNLTVETYNQFHLDVKNRGCDIYPPYYKVREAKKLCYPDDVQISIREASVPVKNLVQHTFDRLLKLTDDVFINYATRNQINTVDCIFRGIWGFDGSTGQSLYKQSLPDGEGNENSIFATTFTPLQIVTNTNDIIWTNPMPQSYRCCRPLHIQYRKEQKELILSEKQNIQNQIDSLTTLTTQTSRGHVIKVVYKLYCAAIDGKVLNAILNTPSQMRCPYCCLTATQFNDLDTVFSTPVKEDRLIYGMSPLHSWIRALEFVLNMGYKMDVKRWRISKNSEEYSLVEERKKRIQTVIREKMGLLVDVVRPTSGTTNDGNTARTAFSDKYRESFAEILGIEKWLLDDIYVILTALSSNLPIDPDKFEHFCKDLAKKYTDKYKWLPMTVTMHKILVHGAKIIQLSPIPIGMMSEQGAETRNKYWRFDREHHCRKTNREAAMFDLFHRALVSSDPVITDFGLQYRKTKIKKYPLPKEAIGLLKPCPGGAEMTVNIDEEENLILSNEE